MNLALWLETDWAFGRIARSLTKYSRHTCHTIPWRVPLDDFSKYDLLYTPCWFAEQIYRKAGGKRPMAVGVHGIAELFNYDKYLRPCGCTAKQIERGRIPDHVRRALDAYKAVGCVSRELVNLLRPQVQCELCYTPVGVDSEFFLDPVDMPLTVLCPVEACNIGKINHGYNVKRWELIREIQRQIDIEVRFLPKRLNLDEMADWYRGGNVCVCLSHSEGGPLPVLESMAGGVIPLSTLVGVMPEIIQPGFNGDLFATIDEAVMILTEWKTKDLFEMQLNAQSTAESRHWNNLIQLWDDFFERVR